MQVNGNGTQSMNKTDENESNGIRRGRREEEGEEAREGKTKRKETNTKKDFHTQRIATCSKGVVA